MTYRAERGDNRSRAHSPEDKAKVRQAFIEAGRRLLGRDDSGKVSLRMIASEAGYSPGSIYQYFHDHRELVFAIRERDMNEATDHFDRIAKRARDPVARVRKLFLGSVQYWLAHLDHFDVLFAGPLHHPVVVSQDGVPFGQSETVRRSYRVYYDAIDALFGSLPNRPMDTRLAADTMIATVHGIVAFPRMTPSMPWSPTTTMAECAIDALIAGWIAQSCVGNDASA